MKRDQKSIPVAYRRWFFKCLMSSDIIGHVNIGIKCSVKKMFC